MKDQATPKISAVMPSYRLENKIVDNIRAVQAVLEKIEPNYEIIVVPDGSPDQTRVNAEMIADNQKIFVYDYPDNRGKGYALKFGGMKARGDLVIFIDGDLDINPDTILFHYGLMKVMKTDVVVGSKRHAESKVDYPALRRAYSLAYQIAIRALFGLKVKDTQVGIKMFKREALEKTLPLVTIDGYAFDIELLVLIHRFGYEITEGPVNLEYQFSGSRVASLASLMSVARDTAIIYSRDRLLRRYSRHAAAHLASKLDAEASEA